MTVSVIVVVVWGERHLPLGGEGFQEPTEPRNRCWWCEPVRISPRELSKYSTLPDHRCYYRPPRSPTQRRRIFSCRFPACDLIGSQSNGPAGSSVPRGVYQRCVGGHGFPSTTHRKQQQRQQSFSMASQSDTQVMYQASRVETLDYRGRIAS